MLYTKKAHAWTVIQKHLIDQSRNYQKEKYMDPITALLSGIFGGDSSSGISARDAYRHTRHSRTSAYHRSVEQEEYNSWFPASYGGHGGHHGVASYYGRELAGHRTASGERFNPSGLTAAHRTLPLGSHVRVWHGGRSVVVRINDRGPFVRGRVMDLSHGAARSLGCGGTCSISYEAL